MAEPSKCLQGECSIKVSVLISFIHLRFVVDMKLNSAVYVIKNASCFVISSRVGCLTTT